MKITIENPVQFIDAKQYDEAANEMLQIIKDVTTAQDETEARANLDWSNNEIRFKHFKYGFGGHHLWVKQFVNNKITGNNILFSEF